MTTCTAPVVAATALPPTSNAVINILDDDPAVRVALDLLARCCGWQTRCFSSGPRFLDAEIDENNACLILDLNMPHMDGEEVLRRLRARGSRLPVLVITGDRQGARLERVRRLGARNVLQKPFGDDAFQVAVQACLDHRE